MSPPPAHVEEVEVVVVGAGAAGSLYAAELARAGRSVLVLEAGPAWTPASMVSSQLWARRLKWGGAPVLSDGQSGHNAAFGWGLGGSALHHYGTWPRPTADTFRLNTLYGAGLDWPFPYETLAPFYDRIQARMGLSGDAAQEAAWRPPGAPYPLPPLPSFGQGETLRRGFAAMGLATAPLPALIATEPFQGRPACLYDGWCDAGCPIGALGHPLATDIPRARKAGATFRTGCTVVRVLADKGRAQGVIYVDPQGRARRVDAQAVVLAGSAVQNPRLLLASASPEHPQGLANRSGLVGAYLTIEPSAHVFGLFPEDTQPYVGVSAGQLIHRRAHRDASTAPARPDGAYQWQIAPAMKPNDLFGVAMTRPELHGRKLDAFLHEGAQRIGALAGFGADIPARENGVELATQTDAHGLPLARIRHEQGAAGRALFGHMATEGVAVMKAAGAREAWAGPLAPGHVTGGTIMGTDPARSVADGLGRAHDLPNLVIAGSGLFPANGGASPTFTLYALALRSAEHMATRWGDYAG